MNDIEITSDGLRVDGHRVLATSATLHVDGREVPVLELRLQSVPPSVSVDLQADVLLDDDTRAALTAIGWTPPEQATAAAAADDFDMPTLTRMRQHLRDLAECPQSSQGRVENYVLAADVLRIIDDHA